MHYKLHPHVVTAKLLGIIKKAISRESKVHSVFTFSEDTVYYPTPHALSGVIAVCGPIPEYAVFENKGLLRMFYQPLGTVTFTAGELVYPTALLARLEDADQIKEFKILLSKLHTAVLAQTKTIA